MHSTPPDRLIGESWNADDLRAHWTHREDPPGVPNAPDLVSVNAHFEHWRALPATTTAGIFYNTHVVSATASLYGRIAWSMGCHAGYNVPDANSLNPTTTPDFPQAMAQQGATWLANTGYGYYGTDDGITGSERLMLYFTQELGRDAEVPLGTALARAKSRYLRNLPPGGLTPYDAKSLQEATLYGLPMYAVAVPNPTGDPETSLPITATRGLFEAELYVDRVLYRRHITFTPQLHRHEGDDGTFFSVGNSVAMGTHGDVGRPLLPSASISVSLIPGEFNQWQPRNVLLLSATVESHTDIDPVIVRPVTDTAEPEPTLPEGMGWLTTQIFGINTTDPDHPRLAATFAFFNAASQELRLVKEAEAMIIHSSKYNYDYASPRILSANAARIEGSEAMSLTMEVEDHEGSVAMTFFTFVTPERIWSVPLERDYTDLNRTRWLGYTDGVPENVSFILQAVDNSGNVAIGATKGGFINLSTGHNFIYLPLVIRNR